jgi:hypothetical protein
MYKGVYHTSRKLRFIVYQIFAKTWSHEIEQNVFLSMKFRFNNCVPEETARKINMQNIFRKSTSALSRLANRPCPRTGSWLGT